MSPDNNIINPGKQSTKEETQAGSNGRKTGGNRPPDPQPLNCPRCDSPNTKFCYYNNYSLTQPRHFCKTCRRYWTKGGALRNVPIGGGCRKTKKIKSSSCSRLMSGGIGDHHSSGESSDQIGSGLKFFHGTLSPAAAMDFQLGPHGLSSSSSSLILPRLQYPAPNGGIYTQFSSFGDNSIISATSTASASTMDPVGGSSFMGFNFPLKQQQQQQQGEQSGSGGAIQGMNVHTNLASSIESLSCMNQDLHWKLQQQRLSMLFGGGGGDDHQNKKDSTNFLENQSQRLQPILFQNLEISRKDGGSGGGGGGGDTATEWFFDSSYAPGSAAQVVNNHGGSNAGASDHNNTSNNWNGIQAWNNDLHQYGSNLP